MRTLFLENPMKAFLARFTTVLYVLIYLTGLAAAGLLWGIGMLGSVQAIASVVAMTIILAIPTSKHNRNEFSDFFDRYPLYASFLYLWLEAGSIGLMLYAFATSMSGVGVFAAFIGYVVAPPAVVGLIGMTLSWVVRGR